MFRPAGEDIIKRTFHEKTPVIYVTRVSLMNGRGVSSIQRAGGTAAFGAIN